MSTISAPALPGPGPSWVEIELPPDLPMPAFTSTIGWDSQRVGALALYCSDGRWGDAFDEFCHRRLQIPRYDRFAVPGGPAWLAQDHRPDLLEPAHQQLEFLVRVHDLERIVLITHWGCAFYTEATGLSAREAWADQRDDLMTAEATLRLWFPKVSVESYLSMRLAGQISFHLMDGAGDHLSHAAFGAAGRQHRG